MNFYIAGLGLYEAWLKLNITQHAVYVQSDLRCTICEYRKAVEQISKKAAISFTA